MDSSLCTLKFQRVQSSIARCNGKLLPQGAVDLSKEYEATIHRIHTKTANHPQKDDRRGGMPLTRIVMPLAANGLPWLLSPLIERIEPDDRPGFSTSLMCAA